MNQITIPPSKVLPEHRNRDALIYVRQSTIAQVKLNQESTQRQYSLQEKAQSLGWTPDRIHVIDGDLGVSGSGRTRREGFQQLVASVSLGEVGAVFGLEISRLARSSADLMKLLELCGLFHTLVVDEDGVYDMSDFNDRLVVGLKGTMGEAELHILRSRMLGGKENAAARGELRFPLPVGYIYGPDRKTALDPDEQVRSAISAVFQAFRTSGSAYGVVRHFATSSLLFPKRAYGGTWDGQLTWGTLTHSRVVGVLHNPAMPVLTYMAATGTKKRWTRTDILYTIPYASPKRSGKYSSPGTMRHISPGKNSRQTKNSWIPTAPIPKYADPPGKVQRCSRASSFVADAGGI